jgi:hypothetical protein
MAEFNSSSSIFGIIESFFGKPASNKHEELFGAAGHAGPELYRNSIKFHTWFVVSQIAFWGGQIVARDANALIRGLEVGNPLVGPELAIFGIYVAVAIGQLWLAPQTFLNYCLVTNIEELAQEQAILEACMSSDNKRVQVKRAEAGNE